MTPTIHGYKLIHDLTRGLSPTSAFMTQHGFKTVEEFRGRSLPYFNPHPHTHADLVQRQAAARAKDRAKVAEGTVTKDTQWTGDKFVEQSQRLVAGQ